MTSVTGSCWQGSDAVASELLEQPPCLQTSGLSGWPLAEFLTNTSMTLRKSLPPFKPVFCSVSPVVLPVLKLWEVGETPSKVLSPGIKNCLLLCLSCGKQQLQGTLGLRVKAEAVGQGGRE